MAFQMKIIPVEADEGGFVARMGARSVPLLMLGGGPLPLLPGWTPVRVVTDSVAVAVMQLRHIDGRLSVWFLDNEFRYITNTFADLPDGARGAVVELLTRLSDAGSSDPAGVALERRRITDIAFEGTPLFNDLTLQQISALASFWHANDYVLVRNALTAEAISLLERGISFEAGNAVEDPRQFHRVHNDEDNTPFVKSFLEAAKPFYELVLDTRIITSYAFAMKYIKNSDMHPHYDNHNNPISSTVCYHFTPGGVSNPLYLDKARFANPYPMRLTVTDRDGIPSENVVRLDLQPGDIAVFRGRNHLHWRDAVSTEMDYRALLLHFSDYSYKGTMSHGRQIVPHITGSLVDMNNYDEFRSIYTMYFEDSGKTWI